MHTQLFDLSIIKDLNKGSIISKTIGHIIFNFFIMGLYDLLPKHSDYLFYIFIK
jgi:hypothetical protein